MEWCVIFYRMTLFWLAPSQDCLGTRDALYQCDDRLNLHDAYLGLFCTVPEDVCNRYNLRVKVIRIISLD